MKIKPTRSHEKAGFYDGYITETSNPAYTCFDVTYLHNHLLVCFHCEAKVHGYEILLKIRKIFNSVQSTNDTQYLYLKIWENTLIHTQCDP
jgi:hypothetical protein